jgi:hypothetical protein
MGTRPRLTSRRAAKGSHRAPGAWSPGGEASAGTDAEADGEASPASGSVHATPPSPTLSPTEHANTANPNGGIGQAFGIDRYTHRLGLSALSVRGVVPGFASRCTATGSPASDQRSLGRERGGWGLDGRWPQMLPHAPNARPV